MDFPQFLGYHHPQILIKRIVIQRWNPGNPIFEHHQKGGTKWKKKRKAPDKKKMPAKAEMEFSKDTDIAKLMKGSKDISVLPIHKIAELVFGNDPKKNNWGIYPWLLHVRGKRGEIPPFPRSNIWSKLSKKTTLISIAQGKVMDFFPFYGRWNLVIGVCFPIIWFNEQRNYRIPSSKSKGKNRWNGFWDFMIPF